MNVKGEPLAFGVVSLVVGLGTGYLMISHPEGLNPSWPIGAALIVPAVFTLGGLHLIGLGLGYPGFSAVMLRLVMVGFLAIANWAAFFTARVPCQQTVSFFGVPLLRRYPSEIECRTSFRMLIGSVDAVVVLFFLALAWHRMRQRPGRSTE